MSQKKKASIHLFAIEKLTILYIFITSVILIFSGHTSSTLLHLYSDRLFIVCAILLMANISAFRDLKIIRFSRNVFVAGLLIFWYPETFEINRIFFNYDHLLAGWEQFIFGCQPALEFSKWAPYNWLSEILNLGYFAYYPLIICSGLYFYFTDIKYFRLYYFSLLFAFFCYYLIFILFPTAGPQYYFEAIGQSNTHAGTFPAIGTYFNTHPVLSPIQTETGGFFQHMVESTQQVGERPTAAFPSSHVGISTLIMLLIARRRKYIAFGITFPIYLALVTATVYIQAHYLIDVIAGLISSVLFYFAGTAIYNTISAKATIKNKAKAN